MNIDEDKFSSNLIALARKVQAAFKSVIGGKPKIEQEGRYLLVSVAETDLDYVTQTMKGALPSNWKEFDVAADEEGTTFEYAPAQRIGAPFASVYAEDDGESSVALLGTYTDADLREGVLNVYQQSLMEKRSPGTLRGKILELRQAVGGENLYELGIMLGERSDPTDSVKFQGKLGVWRSTAKGNHIFIPDKGEPMVGKSLTLKKAQAASASANAHSLRLKQAPAVSGGAGAGDAEPVTQSNWKGKWKAFVSNPKVKKLGNIIQSPYLMAKELVKDPKTRQRAKDHIKNAVKNETEATKKMFGTLGRAIKKTPPPVTKDEAKEVVHQVVDLVKAGLGVATLGHMAAHGLAQLIASLLTPMDELVGMAIDHPLRAITKKVFGKAHGILPSAFYEGPRVFMTVDSLRRAGSVLQEADKTPEALFDEIIDAILDEMAKDELE